MTLGSSQYWHIVRMTAFGYADLIVGAGIAIYVLAEAREIFVEARRSKMVPRPATERLLRD